MSPSRPLAAATLLLLAAAATRAQTQERFVESIEVRVADVDVVVTDRDGNPLTELTRENFELYEDGTRVEIAYFSRIVEGRLVEDGAGKETGAARAPAEDRRAELTWAIFLDQTNMRPARRNEALRKVRAFLHGAMREGDRAIVATFDGLTFRVRGTFTGDRRALLETLSGLEREKVVGGPASREESMLRGDVERAVGLDEGRYLGDRIFTLIESESARELNAVAAFRSMMDVMAGVEGRQAIVYIGAGFSTLPGLGVAEVWRRRFPLLANLTGAPRPEDHQAKVEKEIRALFERASGARITVYSILASDPDVGTVSAERGGAIDMDAPAIAGERAALAQVAAARELADRTGGTSFVVNETLDVQMKAVLRDLTHYYSLGYAPEGPAGRRKDLTVKVNVDGARVRYREALRERTAEERASDSVVAALFSSQSANALGMSIDFGEPRSTGLGRTRLIPVSVKVPVASLAFLRQGDIHRGGLTFHVALAAPDGTVWRLESREQQLEIPHAEFASALEQHVTYSFEIPQQSRTMRVAVSVQDHLAPQSRSVVTVPLNER